MQFYVDKNSPTPVVNQIQEQIKLAVTMGIFRDGDTLPSIRDIVKQTGVARSQIHKAYLALRKSGLLVLTRGKGTVVATAVDSPRGIDESCRKLSRSIVSKARQMGISPTAFARYLSRYAQENERNAPFIIYADIHEEFATLTADEISKLWQVPVMGVAFRDLKQAVVRYPGRAKILVNRMMCDGIRDILRKNRSDVIPLETLSAKPAIQIVKKIKRNSSVMVLYMPQPSHQVRFILAGVKKLMEPRGIRVSSCPVRSMSQVRELLRKGEYDYYYVGPAARGEVPPEMRKDPRVLLINPQLDAASLETARVRAGVVI
jgi:DNA-binding transcriptional regulator YhcF (GntR family)